MLLGACGPTPTPPPASDFDILAQNAEGYQQARPGTPLSFPRDHGPHPDYRVEWWYLTANLFAADGTPYGVQWTLFRQALAPQPDDVGTNPWLGRQVWMAHAAVSTSSEHFSFQRYARGGTHGGLAQAGVATQPFAAWLDDWRLESVGADWLPLTVSARDDGVSFELALSSDRAPVPQGDAGFSQKHPEGGGSMYYSHPWLQATGTLTIDGQVIEVTGDAWLDREWSSQFLQPDQQGWDWFALHLDSGEKLMLYRLRGSEGADDYAHGVLLSPGGTRRLLDHQAIDFRPVEWSRVAGRRLPTDWVIELSELNRTLRVTALHPDQWMATDFAYWEGVVTVSGD
ncbi:MAG: lipocalin-like domain-containing protein, partial [Xanthomonadales bacterium]|nr:lipocalin-like domain-containing protein [Xanthomonadales bacterium]